MKRYRLFTAISLVGALLLASCSQDETIGDGNTLPEGKYPLEIASVTMSVESSSKPWSADVPKTRVSENTDRNSSTWEWNGEEQIGVQLYAGDVATYTLKPGKILTPNKTLYWKDTEPTTVQAWYPAYEGESGTVRLDDQSNKLAYVLKGSGKGNYNSPVELSFEHALAKVRVVLKGSDKGEVTDVMIQTYTSCTHTQGEVSTKDTKQDWITMQYVADKGYWEANVVPTEAVTNGYKISKFKVKIKDSKTDVEGTLEDNGIAPAKAKVNIITLTAGKDVVEGGTTIDKEGEYLMKGSYNETITINCTDKVTLTLDEVESTAPTAIHVKSGTPTIVVRGKGNKFTCSETPILLDPNASVIIEGEDKDNRENNELTVQAGGYYAGIGSGAYSNASSVPKDACGTIKIENVTLNAKGSNNVYCSGAGIGTAGRYAGSCGKIEITNSVVVAQGGAGAAAIGLGFNIYNNVDCGKITITESKIDATVVYFDGAGSPSMDGYGACIGHGAYAPNGTMYGEYITHTVGEISITSTSEDEDKFFSDENFKGKNGNTDALKDFYKAGKGTRIIGNMGTQVWYGVKFNGTPLTGGDSNGYLEDAVQQ